MTDIDYCKIEKHGDIERVTKAHISNVLICCIKTDLVNYYNQTALASSPSDEQRTILSYDTNEKTKDLVPCYTHSSASLDKLLKIPSRFDIALGFPVRVLRAVEAFSGEASRTIPKNAFGVLKSVAFDLKNPCLTTAQVEFKLDENVWISTVIMVTEQFDRSDFNRVGFTSFFSTYSHRTFMPLKAANAVTITSVQGLEFDQIIFDCQEIGQWIPHVMYMALTRVRSSKGIKCINLPPETSSFNKNDADIVKLYEHLESLAAKQSDHAIKRNDSFLTMDFVNLLESFKVFSF